ncbi:hypothetical protein SISNIDRAFT_68114 [Sistotremastrum niveocremeum HHB9708]|uniref:Uncharacterized protein n=2 Tax=Sistotremastraceae TaxID=3402574 RepID=A0A164V2T4_9AGAM|nr:hypothetical protein SISNIDRAFT_68114 [Sistotremastrum niveocremeum HHB9708]KZT39906.1 hypothetical protein SISSUDRAFT_562389 [Sistotremastrum suecicum HHB10207 ss-3]
MNVREPIVVYSYRQLFSLPSCCTCRHRISIASSSFSHTSALHVVLHLISFCTLHHAHLLSAILLVIMFFFTLYWLCTHILYVF